MFASLERVGQRQGITTSIPPSFDVERDIEDDESSAGEPSARPFTATRSTGGPSHAPSTPLLQPNQGGAVSLGKNHQYWSIYDTPSLTEAKFDWKSVFYTVLTILSNGAESVTLPLWIEAFGPALGGPYFILLFTSIAFTFIFAVCALVHWLRYRLEVPGFFAYWPFFAAIGACDSINGLLVVYASPPDRTPPLLQALLPSTSIFFSLIFTRLLVSRRDSPIDYCRLVPIIALLLVFGGIVVSLIPTIQASVESHVPLFRGGGTIVWSLVFILGIAPSAVLGVIQEKFLKKRKRSERGNSRRSLWFDITVMLFYSCVFQLIFIAGCFWVDIIPGYGLSKDLPSFLETTKTAFGCFFLVPQDAPVGANCPNVLGLGWAFTGCFVIAYLAGSALNESSANYGNIANTLVSPLVAFFWILFPKLNNNNGSTPLKYILPALAMLMAGSVVWRLYENAEKRKHLKPATKSMAEQYGVVNP